MKGSEFSELKAFVCVAEEHSFRRAAERLGISPSALSHTIRALEERLGARLLNRTTRSVAPTEAGQTLLSRLRPAMEEIFSAVRDVGESQEEPRGRIRINIPRIAARLLITPLLPLLREKCPNVSLDVVIDDSITDIVGKGFDAGIRSGERVQQDMIAVRLTPDLRMAVVGSPDYFSRHPMPLHPQDLQRHQCLAYCWAPDYWPGRNAASRRYRIDCPDPNAPGRARRVYAARAPSAAHPAPVRVIGWVSSTSPPHCAQTDPEPPPDKASPGRCEYR